MGHWFRMVRLVWLAATRDDPEESFLPLAGIRPAPEPIAFSAATPDAVARRLPNVILVDGRGQPEEAAATIQKLRNDTEAAFLAARRGLRRAFGIGIIRRRSSR